MDIDALKTEIDADPLTRGYTGMTDTVVATDMNTEYRTIKRKVPIGEIQSYAMQHDLYLPITDATSHGDKMVRQAAKIFIDMGLLKLDTLDFGLTNPDETEPQIIRICDALVAGIPEFTETHKTGILALADVPASRATELGLGLVSERHVEAARL